ncbi:MAG: GEVED domain-containing protein [Bacteroidales bacterium]|nr:GEVED domain-containing protein [Bacteroidales bacterium]
MKFWILACMLIGINFSVHSNDELPFKPSSTIADATWYKITSYSGYLVGVYEDFTLSLKEVKTEIDEDQYWCFIGNNEEGFLIYNKSDVTKTVGIGKIANEKDAPILGGTETKWYIRTVTNASMGTMYSICPIEYKDQPTASFHWNNTDPKNTILALFPGANGNVHSHWTFTEIKEDEEPIEPEGPFIISESVENAIWYRIKAFAGIYATVLGNNTLGFSEMGEDPEQQWCFVGDNENGFVIYNKANTDLMVGVENEIPKLKEEDGTRWYMRELNNPTKGKMYAISLIDYKNEPTASKNWNNNGGHGLAIQFWAGGASNNHSHWTFEKYVPKEYLPVMLSKSIEDAHWYRIQAYSNHYAIVKDDFSLSFSELPTNDDDQLWCFVGERNDEGLTVYNKKAAGNTLTVSEGNMPVFEEGADMKWYLRKVNNADKGTMYSICPIEYKDNPAAGKHWNNKSQENQVIQLFAGADGNKHSHWIFKEYRTPYQTQMQIYNYPCGSRIAGNAAYLESASIKGEAVQKPLIYEAENAPSTYYIIYTKTKPVIERGKTFDLILKGHEDEFGKDFSITDAYIYCDWDKDGYFETTLPVISEAMDIKQTITVPEDAELGKMRIRIRYTEKGVVLPQAEDDVWGMVYDFVFNVVDAEEKEGRIVTVKVNDETRGSAEIVSESDEDGRFAYGSSVTVKATPEGNSVFRYWKDGDIIVSIDSEYTFEVGYNVNLMAYFTPNTEDDVRIEEIDLPSFRLLETNGILSFYFEEDAVVMDVYSLNGKLALRSYENQVSVKSLPSETYVVRVYTANHVLTKKIILNLQ